ncbi:MAG: tRNA (adenosine(37)-N6)-threonylcarbamoyltransferase complex dimerization subunit type 1 TsaB [Spirochaetaceae bacterium]|nr:MAG: tRNA (adenosine(37)-N6)-threonylcarbamoyltransferase complex dimerization subunit type 1 TsaB [Spirochaetaceae bacterium]
MTVLSLDTSTSRLSVALMKFTDAGIVTADSAVSLNDGIRHAEQLLPAIAHLLTKTALRVPEIDLVVVAAGPGSFTGLRIGFSTAKGLLAAGAADYLAVPAADCYAVGLSVYPGLVVPVLDARKKRWYGAVYQTAQRLTTYLDLAAEDFVRLLETHQQHAAPPLITGPDAAIFLEQLSSNMEGGAQEYRLDPRHLEGIAAVLAKEGRRRYLEGERTPEDAGPDYLRMSEAEIGIRQRGKDDAGFRT